jgi:hypothetical protein
MIKDPQAFYIRVGRLVETMPDLTAEKLAPEMHAWVGRAFALVAETNDALDMAAVRVATSNLESQYQRWNAAHEIRAVLYRVLAKAELDAPVAAQGAFVPAGNSFDALAAIAKILGSAERDLLLIDPYMDEKLLTDFAASARETVQLRLLADEQAVKSSLRPASQRWVQQYGAKRPLQARLSSARSLHDRLIIVDGADAWILTQSFNAFAARSPASANRSDAEVAALKIPYYEHLWVSATPL